CLRAAPTGRRTAGSRTIGSRASRNSICITFIARWPGSARSENQQDGATPFAPRCLKDVIEETLFARRRDLFSTLDLVFMDTTSLYFEGAGGQTLGQGGFSKEHRP